MEHKKLPYWSNRVSIGDYHRDTEHLSTSMLKQFMVSPAHFEQYKARGYDDRERKAHFDFGNAFELFMLDPSGFIEDCHIWDDTEICSDIGGAKPRSTKAYKQWLAEDLRVSGTKYRVPRFGPESLQTMQRMLDSIRHNKVIGKLTEDIEYQASCYWIDPDTGVPLKSRPDVVHRRVNVGIDVKTTTDGHPDTFLRDAMKYNYALQAIQQIQGVQETGLMPKVDVFYWLVCEKQAPYHVQLYEFTPEDQAMALTKLRYWLRRFKAYTDGLVDRKDYSVDGDRYGVIPVQFPQWHWQ